MTQSVIRYSQKPNTECDGDVFLAAERLRRQNESFLQHLADLHCRKRRDCVFLRSS